MTYSLGGQLTAAELWDSTNKSRGCQPAVAKPTEQAPPETEAR